MERYTGVKVRLPPGAHECEIASLLITCRKHDVTSRKPLLVEDRDVPAVRINKPQRLLPPLADLLIVLEGESSLL